jgi:hypothetical protein
MGFVISALSRSPTIGSANCGKESIIEMGENDNSYWYGDPEVMRFKGGKLGAYSMQFDDSMMSQANVAIPHLNWRGLVGTFFVNPGRSRYQEAKYTWEVICPRFGHELANHTISHRGAKDYEEADHEIGECSRHIWRLYSDKSKLLPFARGGGTTWDVTREQVEELMTKYFLYRRPSSGSMRDDIGTGSRMTSYPQRAIDEGVWVPVHFHGIAPEYLSVSEEAFVELLDYLVANRGKLWIGTAGSVYKYQQEYNALSDVSITDAGKDSFRVVLECDESKVNTYSSTFVELYDEPLTVRNEVPKGWSDFFVRQGREVKSYSVTNADGRSYAQYDVRPDAGEAIVTSC